MNEVAIDGRNSNSQLFERYCNSKPNIVSSYQHYTVKLFNFQWALKKIFYRNKSNKFSLDTDVLYETASKILPFTDFGDEGHQEGLKILVDSLNKDCLKRMHPFGVYTTFWEIVSGLCRRLALEEAYKRYPLLKMREIKNPFYIIGMPRSGTTFLHGLMAQDDGFRWIPKWESLLPIPENIEIDRDNDPRKEKIKISNQRYLKIAPNIQKKHFVEYDKPDECIDLFKSSFRHPAFAYYTDAISFLEWISDQSMDLSYRHYLRLLKVMDSNLTGKRWLFKAPIHMAYLKEIKGILPKSKFIHIHRDPMKTLPSQASLHATELGVFMPKVDCNMIGMKCLSSYNDIMRRYLLQRKYLRNEDIIDIQYTDFIRNPIGTIQQIYKHFNLDFKEHIRERMLIYISNNSKAKNGKHLYDAIHFGFIPEKDRCFFEEYQKKFTVQKEYDD